MEKGSVKLKTRVAFVVLLIFTSGAILFAHKWEDTNSFKSETISFRSNTFEVVTVSDISKIIFGLNDSEGNKLNSFKRFKEFLNTEDKTLQFAVNGGMYLKTYEPQGLFIEKGIQKKKISLDSSYGNFYMMPNGVFTISNSNVGNV